MKPKHNSISKILLILPFVCAILISTFAQGGPLFVRPALGRVIVAREPNFGWDLAFNLQIDGRSVANVVQGRGFDGWLPAGHHVLTVFKVPYVVYRYPTSITVNIQPGRTHLFTAMWDSNLVYLRPAGTSLTPGAIWQQRGDIY